MPTRPFIADHHSDELSVVLTQLVAGVRDRLDANYVGAYLQGSLAIGDFDEASDVDFLIVVDRDVSDEIVKRLQEFHRSLFKHPSRWAQHLEGSYVPRAALASLPPPRRELLYLDHGSTTFERSAHDHYLAVLWTLRERGVTLDGPDPKSLIPPIPPDALREETRTTMVEWAEQILSDPAEMSSCWYQTFAVLSYCRMAETLRTGEVHSKRRGAAWALNVMESKWKELIERAQRQRLRPLEELAKPADSQTLEETRSFIRYILDQHT